MRAELERWWYVSSTRDKLEAALSLLVGVALGLQFVVPIRRNHAPPAA